MQYRIDNLRVSYTNKLGNQDTILHDFHLEINEGEFIGLLGPSGSGKTQLANAMARLNQFFGAEIHTDKQIFSTSGQTLDLSKPTDLIEFKTKHISYIFQEAYSYFNPLKKIKHHFETFKSNGKDILAMMESLNLKENNRILDSYPHQLSGGQLQRLAIIRSLVRKPSILIADEVDSALDETNAGLVMNLLIRYKAEMDYALIWITHDQQKAKEICSRIWYVENGQIIYDSNPGSFLTVQNIVLKKKAPVSNEVLLDMIEVSKVYNREGIGWSPSKIQVLKSVTLKVYKHEIVGLIGASGSGKSTIGKILAGLETFDKGAIWINGLENKKLKPTKNIIYLFQDAYSALNPEHSVQEILTEALAIAASKWTISDLLKKGHLEDSILAKKSNQLSGGMRQRLALVRALALDPDLIILDESLNAMDEKLKKDIISLLLEHQSNTGMSILLISHQLPEVISLADRIYAIVEGEVHIQDLHTK